MHEYIEKQEISLFCSLFPLFLKMESTLNRMINDETFPSIIPPVQQFKEALKIRCTKYYGKNYDFFTSTLLNPFHKDLSCLNNLIQLGMNKENSQDIKAEIIDTIKSKYHQYLLNNNITQNNYNQQETGNNPFLKFDNDADYDSPYSELERYLRMNVDKSYKYPLQWWKNHKTTIPHLASFSSSYPSIPGSAAFIERLWSKGRDICDEKRHSMNDETLELLTFCKDLE